MDLVINRLMIGRREVTAQMMAGLWPHKLQWQGFCNGVVREKRFIGLTGEGSSPYLVIRDELNRYYGIRIVDLKTYREAKVGQIWRRVGFVTHDQCQMAWIVTCEDPETAIRRVLLKSWGTLIVIAGILSLALFSLTSMLYHLLTHL